VKNLVSFQSVVDSFRNKKDDPKAINEQLAKLGSDRRTQAAIDNALRTCSGKVQDGAIDKDDFWVCVPQEFEREMQKPMRIQTEFTPKPGVT
jgi:hypothetical protein